MVIKMWYYSLNEYLRAEFGEKLYKVALRGLPTCPNRDGTLGERGCIFCSDFGSGEFAEPLDDSPALQIARARERIAGKTNATRLIAYFQSFTNTYAPADILERLFRPVIEQEDVAVLSIATRPDCLPNEVLDLLAELVKIKPVWVELGLQTANEQTARYIRRGYENKVFLEAVEALSKINVKTVAHEIIGLPGETFVDYLNTANMITSSGAFGIKIHLLHVLYGTDLEAEYARNEFRTLEKEEYLEIITDLIEYLPPSLVIHRLTGDGAKRDLIAPLWSANKKDVLNSLFRLMREKDTVQGRLWKAVK